MIKPKLLPIVLAAVFLLWTVPIAVLAQGELPPSYTGLKNPFPWGDTSAQQAGKKIYQQSCLGCHGTKGNNIAGFDFSTVGFPQSLKERPDFYFWVLSEGRLAKGMPPYKASLAEEQRWQVLTYLWSLGTASPAAVTSAPAQPPAEKVSGVLLLTVPKQAQSGQLITISATLNDSDGKPVKSATVVFFIKVDFFTNGLMEIGEAVTDDRGVAVLEYAPRQTGDIQVVARYETIETAATLTLTETDALFFQAETGLRLPAPGKEIFIGPESTLDIGNGDKAPTSVLRLPGGILSWLLFLVVTVMLIWFTYFRVLYQVFRIPVVSEIRDIDTRLVPLAGLAIVVALGIMLVLMLITGPYSHFHLLR